MSADRGRSETESSGTRPTGRMINGPAGPAAADLGTVTRALEQQWLIVLLLDAASQLV